MSQNNSIMNLLNLKDKNIIFDEKFCTDDVIKGVQCKIFNATLTYKPKACYSCGHVFDEKIIKHGFKTSTIKIPNVSGFSAYLKLKIGDITASIVILLLLLKLTPVDKEPKIIIFSFTNFNII